MMFIFILFSCKKNEIFKITPEYSSIKGEWVSINGNDYSTISLSNNGIVIINKVDQRSLTLKTNRTLYQADSYAFYGKLWDLVICLREDKFGVTMQSKNFYANDNRDTLLVNTGHEDYETGHGYKEFIRK